VPGLGYAYTITPTRVWTRGDGYRYRDHPYIEFASKADAEKVWKFLLSQKHQPVKFAGPFASNRTEGILIGNNVFVKAFNVQMQVIPKSKIDRSPVMHFIADEDEDVLFWMIEKRLKDGKPINIDIKMGRQHHKGKIAALNTRSRVASYDAEDGDNTVFFPVTKMHELTIKTVDGVPTVVKK